MSDSLPPHRGQPTRLPHRWDSPGKNTGVGCHFLLQCLKVKSESEVAQSCPTPSNPMECSLPGSSVHGIVQARVLECVAIAFSSLMAKALFRVTWGAPDSTHFKFLLVRIQPLLPSSLILFCFFFHFSLSSAFSYYVIIACLVLEGKFYERRAF